MNNKRAQIAAQRLFASEAPATETYQIGSIRPGQDPIKSTDVDLLQKEINNSYCKGFMSYLGKLEVKLQESKFFIAFLRQLGKINSWDSTVTYETYYLAEDSMGILYYSLQDNNINHELTDTDWWKPVIDDTITIEIENVPTAEEENSSKKILANTGALGQQYGIAPHIMDVNYRQGGRCKHPDPGNNKIYISRIDDNIGNPVTDLTKWQSTGEFTDIVKLIETSEESGYYYAINENTNVFRLYHADKAIYMQTFIQNGYFDFNSYIQAHAPAINDNSNKLVTSAWVNQKTSQNLRPPIIKEYATPGQYNYYSSPGTKYITVELIAGGGSGCFGASQGIDGEPSIFQAYYTVGGKGATRSDGGSGGIPDNNPVILSYVNDDPSVTLRSIFRGISGHKGDTPEGAKGGDSKFALGGSIPLGRVGSKGSGGGGQPLLDMYVGGGGGAGSFMSLLIFKPNSAYSLTIGKGGQSKSADFPFPQGRGGDGYCRITEYFY